MPEKVHRTSRQSAYDPSVNELYGIAFFCPGCKEPHAIPTLPSDHGWVWNRSTDSPTVAPSILIYEVTNSEGRRIYPRCHFFIKDGQIEFCQDSQHPLAGKTVEIPDWKGWDPDLYK